MKKEIAGVVVIYNPSENVLQNIYSYLNQIDRLFIVDNSENKNESFVENLKNILQAEYIWNGKNIGIASALNIGVENATEKGYKYILTMDQDSEAPSNMVSILLNSFLMEPNIAIVAPILYHPIGRNEQQLKEITNKQVLTVWTSGNLVKLDIFKKVGGYKDDFFIDYVDHEFCLRLNSYGFKIYICSKTALKHNLGSTKEKNLFFRKVYPTNHSHIRLYYRARNRFYVKKVYQKKIPRIF